MIFVDSNVFIYAVGRDHPLKSEARKFFLDSRAGNRRLVTSAEVLQELLHVYLPFNRMATLDSALAVATSGTDQVLPVTAEDVTLARSLADTHPQLTARDLLHLSLCRRHGITQVMTFDRALGAVFSGK